VRVKKYGTRILTLDQIEGIKVRCTSTRRRRVSQPSAAVHPCRTMCRTAAASTAGGQHEARVCNKRVSAGAGPERPVLGQRGGGQRRPAAPVGAQRAVPRHSLHAQHRRQRRAPAPARLLLSRPMAPHCAASYAFISGAPRPPLHVFLSRFSARLDGRGHRRRCLLVPRAAP